MLTEEQNEALKPGPLDGIRVVEYGVFHAGPGAGAILGDLGAEVIKIESGFGDPERYWTHVGGLDISAPNGQSLMFEVSNRNKQGIHLDIRSKKGREVFDRLIAGADVFLTNLRKSTKEEKGLDYHTLCRVNPRIIHASVSGYGTEGPMSNIGAFDPMGQARSGMMFLNDPDNPSLIHLAILDQATAIAFSHGIVTALFVRERTGRGQEVHASLYSTGLWLLYANVMTTSILGINPSISWNRPRNSPLRNSYRCSDGKWLIGVHHPEEKYWAPFCELTGQTHLLDDSRFADDAGRAAHSAELVEIFDAVLATRTRDAWMEIFPKHGLMFCPVMRLEEVLDDPQALSNRYITEFDHPSLGRMKIPGYPIHFSACRAGTRTSAPAVGEHTDRILSDLGYEAAEIEKLRQAEVVR
ncbi:MAG: CoA transferase [Desulfobacterales bacterium]|nr:CoA transferase [Desulfobacterales bacterium]